VTDWPFKESTKYLFDFFNSTNQGLVGQDYKIVTSGPVAVAGNPGFKFILEYISKEEQFLGLADQKRTEALVTTLMNGRMYTISFSSYSSQFDRYTSVVENIIDSFKPYPTAIPNQNPSNNTDPAIGYGTSTGPNPDISNLSISNTTTVVPEEAIGDQLTTESQNMTANTVFSTYTDEKYGYQMLYPSNLGLGKPTSMEEANLVGNIFSIYNSSETTSNSVDPAVTVGAVYTNETDLMRKLILAESFPNRMDFNFDSVVSMANEELSLFKTFPSFVLLENVTINLNNNPAYAVEYKYFDPIFRSMLQTKEIFILHDDRLLVLEYYSDPSRYYDYLPIFQEMVNSLEFENR
jgi:hypothetical protein